MRLAATFLIAFATSVGAAWALDPENVIVCDKFGTGFFYIPGTETCVHADTGRTLEEGPNGVIVGQTELAQRVEALEQRFKDAHEGVAVSMAIPLAHIEPQHNFAVAVNWGGFDGSNALGGGGAIRLNENFTFTGGIGVGLEQGVVGGRAGVNLSW